MKVVSTNLGKTTSFLWNRKQEQTGIFKYPVKEGIFLGTTDVANDAVIDRKHHAGVNKACYLFSAEQYAYWKKLYPHLKWDWGMFGENLTINGLDESVMRIGDIYKLGAATVQISQPREPCYKLGVRFGDQGILKQFIHRGFPGTYVRILQEGTVQIGNELDLLQQSENPLTVKQFYDFLYEREKDKNILQLILSNESVPEYKRERLKKFL